MYLTSLANTAKQRFEENLQKEYQSHAKMFLSRAIQLFDKMFSEDESVAIYALENVSNVWDYIESPIHFGHQFSIEEFVSLSSNQKNASKALFSFGSGYENNDENSPTEGTTKNTYPSHIKEWALFVKLVDLLDYLVILIIFIFAAGVVYHANVYPNHQVKGSSGIEFWRIWTIMKIPYWQVYGELYLDTLEASDASGCTDNATIWKADPSVERCPTGDWITPVIAAFYMMLTNWLLLNIVIAMFSARFDAIQERSEEKWRYYRHSVIFDYEDRIPSPLNFPFRILSLMDARKYPCHCPCFSTKGNTKNI
ncbi:unnamed protein product [Mytilus coruscus]|uniref:Ion transport domain-containing protein n=1 Tax=Mytilus coruscus TaxID=42192 RepID=A0A6J8A7Z8_MYTCO|nr:unnamed protein product [Mytilus coruscus]